MGSKITLPIGLRFSLETGLLLDNLSYKSADESNSYIIFNNNNALSLEQHDMVRVGVPITFLFRAYKTEACVTFLKLTLNNQVMVYENERFSQETTDAFNTQSSYVTELSNSQSGFDFSNSDVEFSFGTYLP
ncbi:hypothetical protein N9L92_01405 [Saprospiraceae bacterium]|nr:hypothetical protein [Saprospiraceae bacterium]